MDTNSTRPTRPAEPPYTVGAHEQSINNGERALAALHQHDAAADRRYVLWRRLRDALDAPSSFGRLP